MAKNKYFDYMQWHQLEQDLVLGMADEIINMYGIEIKWIRNPHNNVDKIYTEDRLPDLEKAKVVCVHIDEWHSPYSDNPMFSKFGYMEKTNVKFSVSRLEWETVFGTLRPTEGDIIYIPKYNSFGSTDFFKVTYVNEDNEQGWNTMGGYAWFHCTAEKWIYASEKLNTGNAQIDSAEQAFSSAIDVNDAFQNEPFAQNLDLVEELNTIGIVKDESIFSNDNMFKVTSPKEDKVVTLRSFNEESTNISEPTVEKSNKDVVLKPLNVDLLNRRKRK